MTFDIVIVGAGPAGLSTAIHLADLAKIQGRELSICVLEKGAYVGAHIISGAVFEADALDELIPNWESLGAPLQIKAQESHLYYLTEKYSFSLPQPSAMHHKNNYIVSLGELCQWLATLAEQKGVNIFPGFPAAHALYNENKTALLGVQTADRGLNKDGSPTDRFQPGLNIFAKQTILAEGCRGSLTEEIIATYNLRKHCDRQTYALGIKELWRVTPSKYNAGQVIHTTGWPLNKEYGGGFIYHFKDNLISLGLIVGLDYKNPYFNPFIEFQRFKQHPKIADLLQDAECIRYGARALNEGGYQCIPQLHFPGGAIVGCAAGFVDIGKFKGIHNAIRSGMLAAKAILESSREKIPDTLTSYSTLMKQSPIYKELYKVRNIRPSFRLGNWVGLVYSAIDQFLFRGHFPCTWHYKKADHERFKKAAPSFSTQSWPQERLNKVFLTNTYHREDEPCHLQLKNSDIPIEVNYRQYAGPEFRYCPAGVYEFLNTDGKVRLQINAVNCIHCKTCDIKDPRQNIKWTVPEGGDGPNYQLM